MDITVKREVLLKPLQAINGVVEKKQTLAILSNALLSVKDDHLLVTGTDLEIELVSFVPIETVTVAGCTTVSARKLYDICRALPEEASVRLIEEQNHLMVRTKESCFKLNTLPPKDFPNLEESAYPLQLPIKQSDLKNLLLKTYFAMGLQDVRHYLNGTFLDIGPQGIKCVAMDGHRLALASAQIDNLDTPKAKVILPRKSVLELIRLLEEDEKAEATLDIGESRFRIATPGFVLTSKLLNAQFPDYNRLIPKGTTVALGEREAIKQALTRASILSNEKFRGVRFQLEKDKLRITANNLDQEQAEEAIPLAYQGSEMEIGFNVAYLLDVFSTIVDKTVRCVFSDPSHGMLIEGSNGDENSLYVVMPMRLTS